MTYNIKYDNPGDSLNNWDRRKSELLGLIQYYEPDVLGTQEGLLHQLKYLDKGLANYSRIGVGRDDGKEKGEFSAIYYNKEKLHLIREATFWLSETSETVSVGWDAAMERVCTYGLFENKNNKQKVLVFNTHFDHIGKLARENSAELILKKVNEVNTAGYPVVLMGDFNSEPGQKPIKIINREFDDGGDMAAHGIYGPRGTYTGFDLNKIAERRIDYIFVKDLKVLKYRHIDDKRKDNNYLSDHLPVLAELQ
jgi:endonuclease/exonuclease/phosphatase family metal-dependent hydrolase